MTATPAVPALEGAPEVDLVVLTPETIALCQSLERALSRSRKRVLALVIAMQPDEVRVATAA
jgi:hypothetical protein